MVVYKDFSDIRLRNGCVYCNKAPSTRDHVPSKVFLDRPYPPNLIVVPACKKCNASFSKDEEYVAYLIDYIQSLMSVEAYSSDRLPRIEKHSPRLANRIKKSVKQDKDGNIFINYEHERILNILRTHAFGHIYYELGESLYLPPAHMAFNIAAHLTESQIKDFYSVSDYDLLPEVGSRWMQRTIVEGNSWKTIQEGNYEYYIGINPYYSVRMVFCNFLFGEVIWNETI